MSSASITEITSYLVGNVGSDSSKAAAQTTGQDTFSQVFDKTGGEKTVVSTQETRTVKSDGESIQNHANIQKKNTPDHLQGKQQVTKKVLEEEKMQEAAEKAAVQMVQEVADTLGIAIEEVEQVMESLGMIPIDLLSSENLTQLVIALNPGADLLTIMTNEQLFADLKGLMNTAQDLVNQLAQEFQLEPEQMTELMTGLREQAASQLEPVVEKVQVPVDVQLEEAVVAFEPKLEVEKEAVSVEQKPVWQNQETQEAQTAVPIAENQSQKSKSQPDSNSQSNNRQPTGESFTANVMNQLSQAVDEAVGTTNGYGVSGQEIIDQITEQIKLTVKADTTEMELQLNPASLGSLKVQISSRAGVLTASFITQNEAVKAAIESQMVQLKENFEQQGLKVEAVEVNVEAHGFERSLDQQEREQNRFQEQAKKSGRRISLTGLEESEEELLADDMSEGDKIIADMMIRNGNTVDYTA
ncbi:MAG: flagellar hook-length control protein FliK [Lachnospiraceae bacterium]|nr:flagellar hook-length control protein FliK [Lachnospiraceae bacterium]